MNVTQAMRRLGVSRHVLYRLIDAGELPAYRFGRVIRLRVDDVEAYLARRPLGDP